MFRTIRRPAAWAAALVLVGVLAGCGDSHPEDPFVGTLVVENSVLSVFAVTGFEVEAFGTPFEAFFDVFLVPGDSAAVDLPPDTYEVTVFWSEGSFEVHQVAVLDGSVTTLTVVN
jgi:hypothetical protein